MATSIAAANDPLVVAFQAAGLAVFRGPEEDVLGRFVSAAEGLPDDTILVRLTGDNVVPDSDFVSLLVDALETKGVEVMGTQAARGLPYGLSAEAFRLSALRRAAANTVTPFDREHVTPWLYRNVSSAPFDRFDREMDFSCLRCTLDIPDDYRILTRLFEDVSDPVQIGWRTLVQRLAALPESPKVCVPRNRRGGGRLVLGTAQLGAPYGSVRKTRAPSQAESVALVRSAIRHGITHIDTAQAYPCSEERVGEALAEGWTSRAQVITKLSLLDDVPADASHGVVQKAVDDSIAQSRQNLGLSILPVLLLHRAAHLQGWQGTVWRRLLRLQKEGDIGLLGVSVQSVEEARAALAVTDVRHIQLACNILDRRWDDAGIPALAATRPDVVIHARGALLQGVLLAKNAQAWPRIAGLDVTGVSGWLTRTAEKFGRRDVADLCYAWLTAQTWIDAVVVGMENEPQVIDNAALFARPALDGPALAEIGRTRPSVPAALLNPALWPGFAA